MGDFQQGRLVEPLITAMQSPRRIASAPSPTLCVPVAQADTMQMLWPIAPVSMAIIPEVLSVRALAMNVGATVRGPFVVEVVVVVDHQLLATGARSKDDADVGAVLVGELESGVLQGLLCCSDSEVHALLAAARSLRVHPVRGVEVPDLAGELRLVRAGVEVGDLAEPGLAADQVRPGGVPVVADGADDTDAGDDDAAVVIGFAHSGSVPFEGQTAVRERVRSRSKVAGSSAGRISASGAIRLISPVRTLPGPTSTNVVMPEPDMCSTAATQSTPAVRCSMAWRGRLLRS